MEIVSPKKLIEVSLPLDEINKAAGTEKSIRHGHPSTIHLWWARRPLAATRAVIFAQLVNDPAWKYTTDELKKPGIKGVVTRKRNELFRLVTELVQWENTTNEKVLSKARRFIAESWRETCDANRDNPDAGVRAYFDPDRIPTFHDPFAGGGSIPLEAQRLGLPSVATDLNPVALLINKVLLELPSQFVGTSPVGATTGKRSSQQRVRAAESWDGAAGLAEDVRRYGAWISEEAQKRLGDHYPVFRVTDEVVRRRPDLRKYKGRDLTIIAWLWARTVRSPNPAARGAEVPLVSNFFLSSKGPKKTWLELEAQGSSKDYSLVVRHGAHPGSGFIEETVNRRGGVCLLTRTPIPFDYIRAEGRAGRMGFRQLAIVVDTDAGRQYVAFDELTAKEQQAIAGGTLPAVRLPAVDLPEQALGFRVQRYGIVQWKQLFFPRQLVLLSTLGDLLKEVHTRCARDAASRRDSQEYASAVTTVLGLCASKMAVFNNAIGRWRTGENKSAPAFGRQTLSMIWDAPEVNPFAGAGGDWDGMVDAAAKVIGNVPATPKATVSQRDAAEEPLGIDQYIVSTDPPYYDNVAYADLSDFSYYWLRQWLAPYWKDLFRTIKTPKDNEIIADPYKRGGADGAKQFFLEKMTEALQATVKEASSAFPLTLYYAFKQTDDGDGEDSDDGGAVSATSTGWETFLQAVLTSGLSVTATWPMRTEGKTRMRGQNSNALASSIVLACRKKANDARAVSRREFLKELDATMPSALADMIADPYASIAPVDLQQAAFGPGMAVFSRYKAVLEADGSPMSVHDALLNINRSVDAFFAHAEGDLDEDTRFCLAWFQQHAFESGQFGEADVLARAKGTSVEGLEKAGVIEAARGKAALIPVSAYPKNWDPATDSRVPVWEACHHMCRALRESEVEAGRLLARMPEKQDGIRQLAYRLYTLCERSGWAEQGRLYNDLVTSWPGIVDASREAGVKGEQLGLV